MLDPARDLGPLGQVVLSPIRRAAVSTPLLRMPADDLCWAFNLIRLPATDDAGEAARLVAANEAAYARIRDAGGRCIRSARSSSRPPAGASTSDRPSARLAAAKRRFDPNAMLTPGYGSSKRPSGVVLTSLLP